MMIESNLLELYFHIPFCVKKCNYCDFLSAPGTREQQEVYMGALFCELEGRAKEYSDYTVTSVFVGGGTPSVVRAELIAELMELVKQHFKLSEEAEITMEVNPGTVDEEKLRIYHGAGINRLSIGLQSANAQELQRLGRIHSYEQFLDTYRWARKVGFHNVNVDVMSALPGQSLESYRDTLQKILSLEPMPEHISAYSLIVEEGTPFAKWEEEGMLNLPQEDCERQMYEETKGILGEAGFERYEISNYAKPGLECRHNCGYWRRRDYVGFGIGAASLVKNVRFHNSENLQEYIKAPMECREEVQELSLKEQMEETMFLGLRMTNGVNIGEFQRIFNSSINEVYEKVIQKNIRDGLLEYVCREGDEYLRLTERGLDLSNYVMAQFLLN